MANLPTQDDAVVNGKADQAAIGTQGSTVGGSHTVTNPVFVSGVAQQPSPTKDVKLYINIATSAALAVAMGPTSACAITVSPSQSSAVGVLLLHVYAGWYVKLTGTMANLTCTAVAV